MSESPHDKPNRAGGPRTRVTYTVTVDGVEVERELPFVIGVVGDFSGHPAAPLKDLRDRRFVEIDRASFDQVLSGMTPGVNLRVANTLSGDGGEMRVSLQFRSMDDFTPAGVANQVPPLRALLEKRRQLEELLSKLGRSQSLQDLLGAVLKDTDQLRKLSSELNSDTPAGGAE